MCATVPDRARPAKEAPLADPNVEPATHGPVTITVTTQDVLREVAAAALQRDELLRQRDELEAEAQRLARIVASAMWLVTHVDRLLERGAPAGASSAWMADRDLLADMNRQTRALLEGRA